MINIWNILSQDNKVKLVIFFLTTIFAAVGLNKIFKPTPVVPNDKKLIESEVIPNNVQKTEGDCSPVINQASNVTINCQKVTHMPSEQGKEKSGKKSLGTAKNQKNGLKEVIATLTEKQKNNCYKSRTLEVSKIVSADKRYIVYDNGTVLDKDKKLMWLVGYPYEEKSWKFSMECFNNKIKGNSWRLPSSYELEGINSLNILKKFSKSEVWANANDKKPATFNFKNGYYVSDLSSEKFHHILPVRTHK